MGDRYVFDLDNTLVFTDELNSAAYNYALNRLGYPAITVNQRITREVVCDAYPNLTTAEQNRLVGLKQNYFGENIYITVPNVELIKFLHTQNPKHCLLWTSSDEKRARVLLPYYGLLNSFSYILYSSKSCIVDDVAKVCEVFRCESSQLVFFEDNTKIVEGLQLLKQRIYNIDVNEAISVL